MRLPKEPRNVSTPNLWTVPVCHSANEEWMPTMEITATLARVAMIAAPQNQGCLWSGDGGLTMVRAATGLVGTAVVVPHDRTDGPTA